MLAESIKRVVQDNLFPRRIIQYVVGLILMAAGAVILKRSNMGVPPITAVPDAVSAITVLTIGTVTVMLYAVCVVLQIIVQKKVTVKSLLCFVVGFPFGWQIDLFMKGWDPQLLLWQRILCLLIGIAVQGFGMSLVRGSDLMLPAPDELNRVIADTYNKKLWNVKMSADAIYVIIAVAINLVFQGSIASVGICSVASVLLTGQFVKLSFKLLPRILMPSISSSLH